MGSNNISEKTVYFLGAGASSSSDFNLPVMKGFFREKDFNSNKYPALHRFIKENFSKVNFENLNLEEVITFLELSIDKFTSFGEHPEVHLYQAIIEFSKYVGEKLTIPEQKGCNKHKKIFNSLAGKNSVDTVITINYDLVVDNTLWGLSLNEENEMQNGCLLDRMYGLVGKIKVVGGELPSTFHAHRSLGKYLKLHGSVDWLYCPNQNCGNHQLFFPNRINSSKNIHDVPGNLCNLCGSPLVSVIIPPTMSKSFKNFPKLGLLWSLAYREIKTCDKLMMIGVSLAESDSYLNWLIKSAVRSSDKGKCIQVVNKEDYGAKICGKVERLAGIKPEFLGNFDKFVEKLKNT